MRPKTILAVVVLIGFAGFFVYAANRDKGPLLSSTATPISTEPLKMDSGKLIDPWKVAPDGPQTAKLIEAAKPGVQVSRFFVSQWDFYDEADASGSMIHWAKLTAQFSRRDDSGKWEIQTNFKWGENGWVVE